MSSVLKNTKKIFTGSGGDASLPNRVLNLENNEYKVTYYEIISGASGSLTLPTGATINAGEFGLSGNCILSKIDGSNKPTFESPKTSGGTIVTASLNVSTGAWVASGVYTDVNVALIYSIKIKAVYYSNLTYANIIETVDDNGDFLNKNNNLSDLNNAITARTTNLKMYDMFLTTGNQTTTSDVAANITDLVSPTLTANKRYKISGIIKIACNGGGGVKIQIALPTGATMFVDLTGSAGSGYTVAKTFLNASATLSSSLCWFNGLNGSILVNGEIQLSATAGVIQFGFAGGINTQTTTVYQLGTQLTLTQIN